MSEEAETLISNGAEEEEIEGNVQEELEDSELLNEDDDTAHPYDDEAASKDIEEDEEDMQLQEEEDAQGDKSLEDAQGHEEDDGVENAEREEEEEDNAAGEEGEEYGHQAQGKDKMEEEEEEEEEEEGADKSKPRPTFDPNVMPQVNVQVLAKRKWQVKVYPLKASDFMTGYIHKVFKDAKESLLYLISSGKYSRGKGEMYISSVNQTLRVVQGLMKRDGAFPEVNIEVVKKNDDGVVEEKAYMRFDTKLVRMLFKAPNPAFTWGVHGRKRERLIGSVFVKNLPATTSKDMLRVMFPFAQEINYNPEKFKEGTARLVLKSRSSVIPCLKAFVKVELGGQVLELHPLEKKRNNRDDKSKSESRRRSRSRSASVKSEDGKDQSGESKAVEKTTAVDKELDGEEQEDKSDSAKAKSQSSDKDKKSPDKKKIGPGSSSRTPNSRKPGSMRDGDRDRSYERSKVDDKNRKGYSTNRSSSFRGRSESFRSRGNNSGFRGRRGGMRGAGGDRRFGSTGLNTDVARNAEVTKDMLVLQSQLSMAIKSQLSVLNQTKMAVEQAKMGASSLAIGSSSGMSDADYAYESRGLHARDRRDAGYGQKRKAPQAGLRQNDRGYGKRQFKGKTSPRGGGRAGGRSDYNLYSRGDDYRREMYARAEELRASEASYGAGLGSGSYGSSRSAYEDYYSYGGY